MVCLEMTWSNHSNKESIQRSSTNHNRVLLIGKNLIDYTSIVNNNNLSNIKSFHYEEIENKRSRREERISFRKGNTLTLFYFRAKTKMILSNTKQKQYEDIIIIIIIIDFRSTDIFSITTTIAITTITIIIIKICLRPFRSSSFPMF